MEGVARRRGNPRRAISRGDAAGARSDWRAAKCLSQIAGHCTVEDQNIVLMLSIHCRVHMQYVYICTDEVLLYIGAHIMESFSR